MPLLSAAFVERITIFYWAASGVVSLLWGTLQAKRASHRARPAADDLPADVSKPRSSVAA